VWTGGDLNDGSFEERESDEGDVIAEGTPAADGYGTTPAERGRFIVGTIRDHLRRAACEVHRGGLDDLERACGRRFGWCPACGVRLHDRAPWER
jgi:hypothetical protein